MTATWLTLGEPVGEDRVGALWIGESERGRDHVVVGTLPIEMVDEIDGHEHQHDDGSLALHQLSAAEHERFDSAFNAGYDRVTFVEDISGSDGPLTERQAEVLWERSVLGCPRQHAASKLGITGSTLDSHYDAARKRLQAAKRGTEQLGWVNPQPLSI